jgi:hypothetical protein
VINKDEETEYGSLQYTNGIGKHVLPKEKYVPITPQANQTGTKKKTCLLYKMKDHCWIMPGLPVIMNETCCTAKLI